MLVRNFSHWMKIWQQDTFNPSFSAPGHLNKILIGVHIKHIKETNLNVAVHKS
jgi:hypothetical protein